MKRPSFQFYPSDWLRDTALRSCSVGARGLWIDMICFMHEGTPYGHLKVNHKVILPYNLARMVGETLDNVEGYLRELSEAGVFEYDDDGAIFSRRMVKDETLRNIRAAGGKKGGNPALVGKKVNLEDNHKVYSKDKQKTTPSSSSSSSSSIIDTQSDKPTKKLTASKPDDVSDEVWEGWVAHRKAKKAQVTDLVMRQHRADANKAGITLNDALAFAISKGWVAFNAVYYQNATGMNGTKKADPTAGHYV